MVMETSLRLSHSRSRSSSRGGGGLRLHAKEKLPLASNALLQAHAEVDASNTGGAPSYVALLVRHFYPQLSANIGAGIQLDKCRDFGYTLRGKKAISFTSTGLLGINLKGRLLTHKDFTPRRSTGAVELAWTILDFRKGQDVRLKLGYELSHKMPYFQLRENNWTLNAYMDGKWDVRFDM